MESREIKELDRVIAWLQKWYYRELKEDLALGFGTNEYRTYNNIISWMEAQREEAEERVYQKMRELGEVKTDQELEDLSLTDLYKRKIFRDQMFARCLVDRKYEQARAHESIARDLDRVILKRIMDMESAEAETQQPKAPETASEADNTQYVVDMLEQIIGMAERGEIDNIQGVYDVRSNIIEDMGSVLVPKHPGQFIPGRRHYSLRLTWTEKEE